MSRDKQIEEMTKALCDIDCKGMKCNVCDSYGCEYRMQAEALYNKGYRKQIDAEWVMIPVNGVACYRCGNIDCARLIPFGTKPQELKYCPNCGAKMKCESEGEG